MARANDHRAKIERAGERLSAAQGHILEFSRAIDPETARQADKKSPRTVESYTDNCRRFEDRAGAPLPDLTTDEVIAVFDQMDGLSDDYVAATQSAVKAFYRWADGHGVDPEEIAVKPGDEPSIDVSEVLTAEEFHALREAADDPRARCIIDLLGFTGQRIRVIQTLRVGDVDPDAGPTGRYRINEDADGTKGAEKAMVKRPLLGAQASVRDWLSYHPTGNEEDALITTLPSTSRGEPGTQVAQNTIRRAVKSAAETAGVDKPVNPHAFRHFFATTAVRDYDMDPDTVRSLLGHGPGSRIMETTYKHLSDDDIIDDAEAAYGGENEEGAEEKENPMTPPVCPTCSRALDGHKECPQCGERFGPDAEGQTETIPVEQLDEYQASVFSGMFERFEEETGVEIDFDAVDILEEAKEQRRAIELANDRDRELVVADDDGE